MPGRHLSDANGEFFVYDAIISSQSYDTCTNDPMAKDTVRGGKNIATTDHCYISIPNDYTYSMSLHYDRPVSVCDGYCRNITTKT